MLNIIRLLLENKFLISSPKNNLQRSTSTATKSDSTTNQSNNIGVDYSDEEDDYYDSTNQRVYALSTSAKAWQMSATTDTSTTTKVELSEPLYTFGRLMAIKYEPLENALYLNDYGLDCIYKLTFNGNELSQFRLSNIETILKSDLAGTQSPLNPIMSFMHDSHIYWIDYEEGLKTIVYKSSCIRTIYKAKEAVSVKFINLYQFPGANNKQLNGPNDSTGVDGILSKLVMLKDKSKYKYPPDYLRTSNREASVEAARYANDLLGAQKKASFDTSSNNSNKSGKSKKDFVNTLSLAFLVSFLLLRFV